ncbi:MAG TPA: hypothetical protein VIA98_14215 [Allosphingosinicella sp.]|jgi:hypothetical protein
MSVEEIKREVAEGWANIPSAAAAFSIIDYMTGLNDQELHLPANPLHFGRYF